MAMETAAQGCLQHQHQEDLPQENTGIAVHLLHRETTTTGIGELRVVVVEAMTGRESESESERGRRTAVEVVLRGIGRPFEGSLPHHRLAAPWVLTSENSKTVLTIQDQAEAPASNVLGCFGLSIRTRDIDLEDEFSRYGQVEKAVIVYDQRVRAIQTPLKQ